MKIASTYPQIENADTIIQGGSGIGNSGVEILKDTGFYGVENADKMPVRYVDELVIVEKPQVEQLFSLTIKKQQVDSWQSILLLITVLLLGLAKAFSVNRFKQVYKALFNYRVAQEICSEEKVFFHRVNVLLTINYLLLTALLIYQIRSLFNSSLFTMNEGLLYPVIVIFLVLLYFAKLIFTKILAFIFAVPHLVSDYTFNLTLFNNLLGVLLIPVLSLLFFTSLDVVLILKFLALPVLLISLVMRLLRVYILGSSKGVSYFYIFLYICSLEILPLVVMIKIFILK